MKTVRRTSCRTHSALPSSRKNPTSSGLTSLDLNRLKLPSKRQSSSLLDSPNSSLEKENPGEESSFTDPQELERVIWQRHAPLRPMVPSSLSVHLIWWASGWESLKSWSNSFSKWLVRVNLPLFSSMKSTHSVEADLKEKMRHQEESRLSSWSRCRV